MLTKEEKHEAVVDAEGRVSVKRVTTYKDGDKIISTENHREVITDLQADAAAKLEELKTKITGELAIAQEIKIQEEEAKCALHLAKIAELEGQIQAKNIQIANLESTIAELES